jgi:hypothetical protein
VIFLGIHGVLAPIRCRRTWMARRFRAELGSVESVRGAFAYKKFSYLVGRNRFVCCSVDKPEQPLPGHPRAGQARALVADRRSTFTLPSGSDSLAEGREMYALRLEGSALLLDTDHTRPANSTLARRSSTAISRATFSGRRKRLPSTWIWGKGLRERHAHATHEPRDHGTRSESGELSERTPPPAIRTNWKAQQEIAPVESHPVRDEQRRGVAVAIGAGRPSRLVRSKTSD